MPLPGPEDITRRVLPNGITVLVRQNHTSPSVVVRAMLRASAIFETRETAGLANLTASALMRGTQTRSFDALYEAIESIGAILHINSSIHTVSAFGKSLAEDLPTLLDVLADALRRPVFPEDQIAQLRGQTTTELQLRDQDTRQRAYLAFKEMAYPPAHVYHRSARGYPDTVSALTRDDVVRFHRQHYGPREMIVVVVGAVAPEAAIARVETALGDWHNPKQPETPPLPEAPLPGQIRRQTVHIPDKTQADIVLGAPGPPRTAPDWWPAYLANHIFGVFGLYGRLGATVRDKLGLAYYSYSSLGGGEGPGPWRVIAGVNPKNVPLALKSIESEMARLTREPPEVDELDDSQRNITGALPLRLEANEGVAATLLGMERHKLGMDYLQRYHDTVRAVTKEEVLEAARHYLDPEAYIVAVAGPPEIKTKE